MDTFIGRHGYVQYSEIGRWDGKGVWQYLYPRPGRCEICRSAAHSAYQFDHCHAHGWVRGILCAPCNAQMYHVDQGKVRDARYIAYWSTCPDCGKLGAPPPPRPKPQPCKRCRGCGFLWISCLARMMRCPDCRDGDSR